MALSVRNAGEHNRMRDYSCIQRFICGMCWSYLSDGNGAVYIYSLEGEHERMRLGAFVAPAFSSFPLSFVTYGPLYPNLLSMCMLPCLLSSFILLTDLTYSSKAARIRFGCIFLLGLLASCFAQPNTVFSAAVILAPYCIYQAGIHVPDILHWKRPHETPRFR